MIRAWGMPPDLDRFLERLRENPPPLGRVDTVEWTPLADAPTDSGFHIVPSRGGKVRTAVVPDAASCQACRDEIADPADRRYHYPFTNCTHCGPRLSIVRSVPMIGRTPAWPRSPCARPAAPNMRIRATAASMPSRPPAPIAARACGWSASIASRRSPSSSRTRTRSTRRCRQLLAGAIVAIKGLGGFHLACDALDQRAVAELRARKRRHAKPLALMARDLDVVRRYCAIDGAAEDLLTSAAAPIVILPAVGPDRVAEAVAPGHPMLGFMLPYTPLHHLLLAGLTRPLVMTSGNISDEPQCTDNDETRRRLSEYCGLWGVPRPRHRQPARRFGGAGHRRRTANDAPCPRLCAGAAPAAGRLRARAASPGAGRRAQEHLLSAQGWSSAALAAHWRS